MLISHFFSMNKICLDYLIVLELYFMILMHSQVAARVTPHDADKDEWFVVKVMHFDKETKE